MMWLVLVLAVSVALLTTPLVGLLGHKLGLVDRPNELSIHRQPLPRVGGLAMLVAFVAALAWAWFGGWIASDPAATDLRPLLGLLIGALIVAAAGLLDDAAHIAPLPKFLWQLVGAAVAVGLGVRCGTFPVPGVSFAFTLVFLVGVANAMNLLDGINGLATGVAAIAALALVGLAAQAGQPLALVPALALAGACLGFLPYNYPRARLFMGDVGSLFLGFVLASLAALLAQRPYDWSGLLAPLLALALPLTDTALAMVRRFGRLQDLFSGDREHVYDLLSRRGLGDTRTVLAMVALGGALGGAALWVVGLRPLLALAVTVLAFAALAAFAARLGTLGSSGTFTAGRFRQAIRQLAQRYTFAFALDALVVTASFYAAMLLRIGYGPDFIGDATKASRYLSNLTAYMPFVALIYLLVNGFFGLYSRAWRYAGAQEALSIGFANAVSTVGILIADVLFGAKRPIPLSVVLMGGLLSMLGLVAWRYRRQLLASAKRLNVLFPMPQAGVNVGAAQPGDARPGGHGQAHRLGSGQALRPPTRVWASGQARRLRTLIVGARQRGQLLAARMSQQSQSYLPVGFVDDDPDSLGLRVGGLKVLGDWQAIPDLVEKLNVDLVVVALSNTRPQAMAEIVDRCLTSIARVKIMPDVYADLLDGREETGWLREVQIEDLLGRPPADVDEEACRRALESKVVLVTGAAGSIGSEMCRQVLHYMPKRLLAFDQSETGLYDLQLKLGDRVDIVVGDVRDALRIDATFQAYQPQIVYHAAAYKHVPILELYPVEAFTTNVIGTQTLVETAARHGTERLIAISTDKAVCPSNVMGASKRIGELIVQSAVHRFREGGTVFASVRFGNVLGSQGSVVPTFEQQIHHGGPVTVTDPHMTRYFMSISEAVALVIQASAYARGGEVFILDMGEPVRIDELARRMIRLRGLRAGQDIEIKYTGARPGEKLAEQLWCPLYERPTPTANASILCIRRDSSGYDPTALQAEIDRMRMLLGPGQEGALCARLHALAQASYGECDQNPLSRAPQHRPNLPAAAQQRRLATT